MQGVLRKPFGRVGQKPLRASETPDVPLEMRCPVLYNENERRKQRLHPLQYDYVESRLFRVVTVIGFLILTGGCC